MSKSQYIPITKVDATQRLVWGVATAEKIDRTREVCDYDSTKPHYEEWSQGIAKASGGKSLGNVRAMHGKIAAGKIVNIGFNDAEKQIEVCAKIVDDDEWKKVEEGLYTGFSQGGGYVRKWKDPADATITRYTAKPTELSLVDIPCLPDSAFTHIKSDGAVELRKFVKTGTEDEVNAALDSLEKAAPEAPVEAKAEDAAAAEGEGEPVEKAADLEPIAQVWLHRPDGKTFNTREDLDAHVEKLAKDAAAATVAAPALAALDAINKTLGIDPEREAERAAGKEPELTKADHVAQLRKWLGEEAYDAARAIDCLSSMFSILRGEMSESNEKPEQVDALNRAIEGLKAFIVSEIQEDNSEAGKAMKLAESGELEKAGARNSKADVGRLQKAHDALVEAGAACGSMGKAHDHDDLKKVADERDALQKALDTITPQLAAIQTRLEKMEKTPLPPKTAGVFAVEKGMDAAGMAHTEQAPQMSAEDVSEALAKMNPDERALLLTKAALRLPRMISA